MDHGRGQFAELSPLAEMARNSEEGAVRGGRPPRTKPVRRSQPSRPSLRQRAHPGTRGCFPALSHTAGLGFFTRPQIAAVLYRLARLAPKRRNSQAQRRHAQGWKESSKIAI